MFESRRDFKSQLVGDCLVLATVLIHSGETLNASIKVRFRSIFITYSIFKDVMDLVSYILQSFPRIRTNN